MTRTWKILRRIAFALCALAALYAALFLGVAYWAKPTMVIRNHSGVTVQVEARWGTNRKQLPAIAPGAKRRFKVGGESAMGFVVTYPDGKQISTEPVYFTITTTVTAIVTDSTVEVTSNF